MKEPVIFIVDPNLVHGNLVKYHLNVNRFPNVWLFTNVEECLYRLRKQTPDFLITEYELGKYNGRDMLRMAARISPATNIIFFTSSDDSGLAESILSEGARDYIVKTSRLETSIGELVRNIGFLRTEILSDRV